MHDGAKEEARRGGTRFAGSVAAHVSAVHAVHFVCNVRNNRVGVLVAPPVLEQFLADCLMTV